MQDATATARAFREQAGALRVILLLDAGEHTAVMIDSTAATTEVTGQAERFPAVPVPHVHAVPASAITIDLETGELSAPLGTVDQLKRAVEALAAAFGGLTVVTAEFATRDPEVTITLAAREGEPTVLAAGDLQFELG